METTLLRDCAHCGGQAAAASMIGWRFVCEPCFARVLWHGFSPSPGRERRRARDAGSELNRLPEGVALLRSTSTLQGPPMSSVTPNTTFGLVAPPSSNAPRR